MASWYLVANLKHPWPLRHGCWQAALTASWPPNQVAAEQPVNTEPGPLAAFASDQSCLIEEPGYLFNDSLI